MDTGISLLLFLINISIVMIRGQELISDPELRKDFQLNLDDFAPITDADIRFLLQTMDSQTVGLRVHNTTKYCQSFESCNECVRSRWYPCEWCHDYGCTDKSPKLCPLSTSPRNLSSCPYIHSKNPIFVHSGVKSHIKAKISVSDPALLEKDLICQINMKERMTHLKGIIMGNMVYCFPLNLIVTDGVEVGSFSVIWGGVQPLSNEIALVAYRCDLMAKNCEDCKLLPREYGCGWCEKAQKCSLSEKCNDLFKWALNRMTCQLVNEQMYFV